MTHQCTKVSGWESQRNQTGQTVIVASPQDPTAHVNWHLLIPQHLSFAFFVMGINGPFYARALRSLWHQAEKQSPFVWRTRAFALFFWRFSPVSLSIFKTRPRAFFSKSARSIFVALSSPKSTKNTAVLQSDVTCSFKQFSKVALLPY